MYSTSEAMGAFLKDSYEQDRLEHKRKNAAMRSEKFPMEYLIADLQDMVSEDDLTVILCHAAAEKIIELENTITELQKQISTKK